jgi:hypothetical protein
MKIRTTITAMKDGVCLFETDATAEIDYSRDRYGELEWHVDQWTVTGSGPDVWDTLRGEWKRTEIEVAVPEKLAEVFDTYMDSAWMEEQIREQLMDYDDDRGDYLRDLAQDR